MSKDPNNKIKKLFRTTNIFDIIPVNRWWEKESCNYNATNKDNLEDEASIDNEETQEEFLQSKNQTIKFDSLEHNGLLFPSKYEPHNVQITYQGYFIKLNPHVEELANFWAQLTNNDLSKKDIPRKNFFKVFKSVLRESSDEYNLKFENALLEDFDFSPIYDYFEANRVKNRNKSKEEKLIDKEKKKAINAKYGLAMVDKFPEKISNYMVEPPCIYRGRGDHPNCGRIKPRIIPEEVTINVGVKDPVPVCNLPGHSWKEVINNNKCTWLAMYKEDKNTKYMFLAGNSKFKGKNDFKKYEKARKLKLLISNIREDYYNQMNSDSIKNKQLGCATYLIDILALRVGNEKGEDEADTVGCCSLRVEHIEVNSETHDHPNLVTFDFLGKDSMRYTNSIELDPVAVKCLREFIRGKSKEDDLFDLINAGKLNDYLKSIYKYLSAKVFRTYNASFTLQKELDKCNLSEDELLDNKVKFYNDANRQVAILCNHQKTVSKSFENTSLSMNKMLKDLLLYFEELNEHLNKFKSKTKKLKSSKKQEEDDCNEEDQNTKKLKKVFPDTLEKTQKLIKRLEEKINKKERDICFREDNKQVALNTSKLNYMDPRITVSWCKKFEVPIEKVFPRSVLDKFPWAMNTNLEFSF